MVTRLGLRCKVGPPRPVVGQSFSKPVADDGGRGQNSGEVNSTLPFLFWRVSVAALSSRKSGDARVSRGDPSPATRPRRARPRLSDDTLCKDIRY
jgi:hypothetical protein